MSPAKTLLICFGLLVCGFPPVAANTDLPLNIIAGLGGGTSTSPLEVPVCVGKISVDGRLDEADWSRALVIDLPYETEPTENGPATMRSECLLLNCETAIYVAFRAWDPEPDKIRAHFTERDHLGGEDCVSVVFDTFNDEMGGYRFRCNPLGVQADHRIFTPQGWSDGNWDAIWDSAGKIQDWGFTVEMAIPYSQLRFDNQEDAPQIWGFDATRTITRSINHQMAALPSDLDSNCYMCRLIKIRGMAGADPGKNVEIGPTATAMRNESLDAFPDGDWQEQSQDLEAGLSVSWGVTPNMNLNGTINPDFSQVEADAYVLNINQPWAIYFQEKRPFFTEGREYFNTVMAAVYTRSMYDPSWGLKLTGKEDEHNIGLLSVRDDVTNIVYAGPRYSQSVLLDEENTSSVLRYKKDWGSRCSAGFIATDREGDEYYNRLGGFDGEFRPTDSDRFRIQYLHSLTDYPDELAEAMGWRTDEVKGGAFDLFYHRDQRNFSLDANLTDIGTYFRADLGSIAQVGYRYGNVTFHTHKRPKPGDWYSWLALNGSYDHTEDHGGELIRKGYRLWGGYWGPRESRVYFTYSDQTQNYTGVEFPVRSLHLSPGIRLASWVHFNLDANYGDRIDYANSRLGHRRSVSPYFDIRPGRHLNLELSYIWEKMKVDDARLYEAQISQVTMKYKFNRRAQLRGILQYAATDYEAGSSANTATLFTQFLFSYEVNPQTMVYLGYTDDSYGNQAVELTRHDRTFFMKVGYALMY